MNGKKIQTHMQINVGFVGNATELVKQVENKFKNLNLSVPVFNGVVTGLDKSFKEIKTNLDKMWSGIGKRGLSAKQYENIFNTLNDNIVRAKQNVQDLSTELSKAFSSEKNRDNLKTLKDLKNALEDIQTLNTKRKSALSFATNNLEEAQGLGVDFTNKNINKMLSDIIAKRASSPNIKTLTRTQQASVLGSLTPEQLERVITLYKRYNEQLEKASNRNKEMQQKGNTDKNGDDIVKFIENRISKLEKETITQEELNKLLKEYKKLYKELDEGTNLTAEFNKELTEGLTLAEKLAKTGATIKEVLAQFGVVFSAAKFARMLKDLVKYSFDFYKSLDSALNQIYVVSNLSAKAVNDLTGNFINMAKQTGMSIDDVTRAAVLFYQQGLNTDQVMTMTEVTAQFAKVAGIDATDAADKLTAAVNGYCLAAEDAMSVADKFNKVAAASAADINELSTAFSKAAAQANQAGVSMDNYLAYIATMEEATREAPENIGTSLKTIFSRMQQIKTGENDEDGVDVNQVETALRSVNIALRDTSGQLRDLEEIFDELGPKWQSLDRNTQAYLGTIIAGTRQQSRFITLMQNWDRVQDLAEQSANSAGQQALMHAKAMDSIESKLQQFKVAWQEFVKNLSSSSLFKGVISGATTLLNLLNSGTKPVTLFSAAIALLAPKLRDMVNTIKKSFGDKFGKSIKEYFALFKADSAQSLFSSLENDIAKADTKVAKLRRQLEKTNLTQKERAKIEGQINKLLDEQAIKQEKLNKLKDLAKQKWLAIAGAAGVALTAIGLGVGNIDENLGGMISLVGTFATTIATLGGGPVAWITAAIGALIQLINLMKNWENNVTKRITDSLNAIKQGIQDVGKITTETKSLSALINKYDTLNGKIYKTKDEQEELNKVIQEMADTYDLDTVEDGFGNLSIDIGVVRDKLKDLNTEQQETLEKLQTIEWENIKKGISGLGNDTTLSNYLQKNLIQNKGEYKTLLKGFSSTMISEAGNTGKSMAQSLSNNLKTELINTINRDPLSYMTKGFGQSLIDMETDITTAFEKNPKALQDLYSSVEYLQQNIDNMTFEQAQQYLNNYWDKWHESLNLTQDEWNTLVNSINNTVFGTSNLSQYVQRIKEEQGKIEGSYFEDRILMSQKRFEDYVKQTGMKPSNNWFVKNFGLGFTLDNYPGTEDDPIKRIRAYENAQQELKVLEEYKRLQEEYIQQYAKEHEMTVNEARKTLEAQYSIIKALEGMKKEDLQFFDKIPSLYNTDQMDADTYRDFSLHLEHMFDGIKDLGESTDADKYNFMLYYYKKHGKEMSAKVKTEYEIILKEAYNNLSIPTPITLTQLGQTLKGIGEDLVSFNKIVEDFNSTGGLNVDTFIDLAKLIEGINLQDLGSMPDGVKYINMYTDAIKNLDLAYDANTGYITMNGQALQSLQQIQEIETKSKLANTIKDLEASKVTIQTKIEYIKAQIKATDKAIEAASDQTKSEISSKDIMSQADDEYVRAFDEGMGQIEKDYIADVNNQSEWTTATLGNLGTLADAWGKYFQGIRDGSSTTLYELRDQAKTVLDSSDFKWEGAGRYSGIDWDKYGTIKKGSVKQKELIADLQSYRDKLQNTLTIYELDLGKTQKSIDLLTGMYNSDLSKLGTSGKSGSDIDKYIGKLKEIYNILNRIQLLEHRLGVLDQYQDIVKGEKQGDILQERLSLNKELLDQYQFLTAEQKKFTNGYKEFIQSIDGLEGVFDFDKYGQIIINWEKYNALQDEAAKGAVTLKQKADDVYNTYTSMFKDLQGYFDKTIDYLKNVIKLTEQIISSYLNIENKVASAIKEIYQNILDDRLKAIDKEKEAIEDLRKEREKANKEAQYSKEIAGIQSDIQRAMMDTSGASSSALIKSQNALDEKLDAIAEDKYSEMLDNIITKLDDERTALQEEFDEMFNDLQWLFEKIEKNIMNDGDGVRAILKQTQEWVTSAPTRQKDLLLEWDGYMSEYMNALKDGKTISQVWEELQRARTVVETLDTNLTSDVSYWGSEIVRTLEGWNSKMDGYTSAISGAIGSLSSRLDDLEKKKRDEEEEERRRKEEILRNGNITKVMDNEASIRYTTVLVNPSNGDATGMRNYDNVVVGSTFTLPAAPTKKGARFLGWRVYPGNELKQPGQKITITKGTTITAEWDVLLGPNGRPLVGLSSGGLVKDTGVAMLHGSISQPEAVLDALQTKHFIKFANSLDKMYSPQQVGGMNNSITIDTISFNVDSMSSPEDGEKAFSAFVNKFNEIGSQTGIRINNFNNTNRA